MPWSPSQHRLFCACADDPKLAAQNGISMENAKRMCEEGIKKNKETVVNAILIKKKR